MALLVGLVLVCATACGNGTPKKDDAAVRDDSAIADASVPDDAPPDAMPDALVPTPARELVPGATRMTGGGLTFDVQIGHSIEQGKATGGGSTIEGNAAVKP